MSTIIGTVVTLVLTWIMYYFWLPPINLSSFSFWLFVFCVLMLYAAVLGTVKMFKDDRDKTRDTILSCSIIGCISVGILMAIFGVFSSPLFNAHKYSQLVMNNITQMDISEYTPTIDNVPLMDKETAELLCNRTMGTLVEEVSQYELRESTQINYNGRPVRVMALKYAGFFKWLNNRSRGVPSYIKVDMITQKTDIVNLEKPMRYTPDAFFGDDLKRMLRFKYPFEMMADPVFELDEEGRPFWIVPLLEHKISLFGGEDVKGIIIVDAVDGSTDKYNVGDIPNFVDNAYPSDTLIKLYDYYGLYREGFLNSLFGQRGCIVTTKGYNYIPQNDDIWLYTGVTSVVSDESNIGFIYVNKRTKEYQYYEVPGAEEYSAMDSAMGMVQDLGYKATFPLLLQIEGHPTYCIALKDAGGLVKMYGLINMSQYQIVVTGETINQCLASYRTALQNNGQTTLAIETLDNVGIVEDIRVANKNGTTYFYIKFENDPIYYAFSILDDEDIILVNIGDSVSYGATEFTDENILDAVLIEG